jgi:hypothetical protein
MYNPTAEIIDIIRYCNGYFIKIINAKMKNANQNIIFAYFAINLTIRFIVLMQERLKDYITKNLK